MLTKKGIKPICNFQQIFQSTYLFGAFSPINGSSFMYEFDTCNAETFQWFLNKFSLEDEEEFKIIVLDNGAFHKAKKLKIPKNIILLFLPPYAPELNPAEKIWQNFKRQFTNLHFDSLKQISQFFTKICKSLTKEQVKSTCSFAYIFSDIVWTV
jgi:transposase